MVARIAFVLLILFALPVGAESWWDCGYDMSSFRLSPGKKICLGVVNPDGSCINYDEFWDARETLSAAKSVVQIRTCVNDDCKDIACGTSDNIWPRKARNTTISRSDGNWFCLHDPKEPTARQPRVLIRCHN